MTSIGFQRGFAAALICLVLLSGLSQSAAFAQAIPDEEDFDGVTAPALPGGWSSVSIQGAQNAVTSTAHYHNSPNAAFIPCPSTTSQTALVSQLYTFTTALPTYALNVSFQHKRGMESSWDGGVLEVSINGAPFMDVKHADIGGTFSSGDYNISSIIAGPLLGRAGWTGANASFEYVSLTIPSIPDNATVQFRFMVGTDPSVAGPGWYIDAFTPRPQINTAVEITPLDSEIMPGETADFDIAYLNPSSLQASPFVAYLTSPAARIKRFSLSSSGMFQQYGEAAAMVQGMAATPALGSTIVALQVQDVPGRSGAKFTFLTTSTAPYVGTSGALDFLSSSPAIPGGVMETGMEILAFDPCLPAPDPLPIPMSGKIAFAASPLNCPMGQAALALQNLGVGAAIFMAPIPVPVPDFGEFPAPYVVEAPTPGLTIPVFTYDPLVPFPLLTGVGAPGSMTARIEGQNSPELRTIPVGFMSLSGDEPSFSNNMPTVLISVVTDVDGDGTPDIRDACKNDGGKVSPGSCGCGIPDLDSNANGIVDCLTTPDFKAQVGALQKLVKKLKFGATNFKRLKSQIKPIRSSVKNTGVNGAASISIASAGVNIAKLTKAADKAVGKALGAGSASFGPARVAALKALNKLLKGIA